MAAPAYWTGLGNWNPLPPLGRNGPGAEMGAAMSRRRMRQDLWDGHALRDGLSLI